MTGLNGLTTNKNSCDFEGSTFRGICSFDVVIQSSDWTQVHILFQGKVMDLLHLARMRGLDKLMEGESP